MRRVLAAAVSAALAVTALLATPVAAGTAHTWHVQVGAGGVTNGAFDGRSGNAFYPGRIAAHPGDTVVFTLTSPHTVTFNRPANTPLPALFPPAGGTTLNAKGQFVNSGFDPAHFFPGITFTLTLGNSLPPGRYAYICALHLFMHGVIDVVPADAALPKTDADIAAAASRQIARDLESASDAAERALDRAEDRPLTVFVGAGTRRVTNLRFFPASITVHVGQSITFRKTMDPTEPHTVTFGTAPANDFAPAGGPPFTWDGTHPISTGAMLTQRQFDFYIASALGVPGAMTTATIKFTKAGTFKYICAIHDEAGMVASVTVLP